MLKPKVGITFDSKEKKNTYNSYVSLMMGYDNEDVDIEENKFDEKTANYCFVLS
jgi:hypothetical protein